MFSEHRRHLSQSVILGGSTEHFPNNNDGFRS